MKYMIYKLKKEINDLKYKPYIWLQDKNIAVNWFNYDLAYMGDYLDREMLIDKNEMKILMKIFVSFDEDKIDLSDVIVLIEDSGDMDAYYVEPFGFRKVPEFLDSFSEMVQLYGS